MKNEDEQERTDFISTYQIRLRNAQTIEFQAAGSGTLGSNWGIAELRENFETYLVEGTLPKEKRAYHFLSGVANVGGPVLDIDFREVVAILQIPLKS